MEESAVKINFDPVQTEMKPRQYIRYLRKTIKPDKDEKLCVGEIVEINLPDKSCYFISYSGVKPEKYEVKNGILKLVMTRCVLISIYKDFQGVSKLELFNAL
jgi:hypothetical protein